MTLNELHDLMVKAYNEIGDLANESTNYEMEVELREIEDLLDIVQSKLFDLIENT